MSFITGLWRIFPEKRPRTSRADIVRSAPKSPPSIKRSGWKIQNKLNLFCPNEFETWLPKTWHNHGHPVYLPPEVLFGAPYEILLRVPPASETTSSAVRLPIPSRFSQIGLGNLIAEGALLPIDKKNELLPPERAPAGVAQQSLVQETRLPIIVTWGRAQAAGAPWPTCRGSCRRATLAE